MTSLSMQRDPATNGNSQHERRRGDSAFDMLIDEQLREEMRRLSEHRKADPGLTTPSSNSQADQASELSQLRQENARLREMVEQLQSNPSAGSEQDWLERQKEYEALLDEKSEVIRELHQKIRSLQQQQAAPRNEVKAPHEQDLLDLQEQLEEERRLLREDEEALMKQMKDMELSMSRDRAMLARERQELRRLHDELMHEIEMASRDGQLRERLAALQRRQQEASAARHSPPAANNQTPEQPPRNDPAKKGSGFLRKLFG